MIHPQALVSAEARLGTDVQIGPFSVVEGDTTIGDRTTVASHAVIRSGTDIGADNQIGEGAVLGGLAQHSQPPQAAGRISIGSGNVIREHVTIHRSLYADGTTRVGDRCLLMVGAHVAHDCQLGDDVVMANHVLSAWGLGRTWAARQPYISFVALAGCR